jgi:hypothetical protein
MMLSPNMTCIPAPFLLHFLARHSHPPQKYINTIPEDYLCTTAAQLSSPANMHVTIHQYGPLMSSLGLL